MNTIKVIISGIEIEITVNKMQTNFGFVYVAQNNYGEPQTTEKGFSSENEAFGNEVSELILMISEDSK